MDDFEQDWADVTSGNYTFDELGSGDDAYDESWFDYGSGDYGVEEITNTAQPGEEAYGWRYFSDGTAISPTGTYYYQGEQVWSPGGSDWSKIGSQAVKSLMSAFTKPGGGVDWRSVATVGGGLAGLLGLGGSESQPTGYQGKIPEYTAVREQVGGTYDPERRPGSGGQRYFSDTRFAKAGEEEAARTAAQEEVAGLAALNESNLARQERPAARAEETAVEQVAAAENRPASEVIEDLPVPKYAEGGPLLGLYGASAPSPYETEEMKRKREQQGYARGGIAALKQGKYLSGTTDGMADKIPAKIENKQPAALSHGEFVIPADVVSHLGNGNSDAGAKKLYEMMAKIRQARTGTPKQGKQINPNKYLPA